MRVCYITYNVTQLLSFKKSLCTKAFQSIGVKNPVFSGFFVTYRNLTRPAPGPAWFQRTAPKANAPMANMQIQKNAVNILFPHSPLGVAWMTRRTPR